MEIEHQTLGHKEQTSIQLKNVLQHSMFHFIQPANW